MRYLFEHLGVAVFAITGVLAAKNKLVDLFGVIGLALVTAVPRTPSRLAAESAAVAVTLSLRLVAIRWRLRLPEFRIRNSL